MKKPFKTFIRKCINLAGYEVTKRSTTHYDPFPIYDQDSLRTTHNHDFMKDPSFIAAFERGMQSLDEDHWLIQLGPKYWPHWRVHVQLWVATQTLCRLEGDFVDCGCNIGSSASAVMSYTDWNSLGKNYFGFDTFRGLEEKYLNENERRAGRMDHNIDYYKRDCFENAKENLSEFDRVHLIRGAIPDTLENIEIDKVCFLSIDMNNAAPEIAAANFFWHRLVPGAMVLLDDYAYVGYDEQNKAFNRFAKEKGIEILSLPTGQGLFMK